MSARHQMKRYRYTGEPGQMPTLGGGITINMVDAGIYEADRPLPSNQFQEITEEKFSTGSKKTSKKKTDSADAEPDNSKTTED